MKVVCFAPRASQTYPVGEPWALLHASRLLLENNYEVKIIQSIQGIDFTKELRKESVGTIALGISCITGHAIIESIRAAKIFMTANPTSAIIWGGWHPSIFPEQIIESGYAHCCVMGQGEISFFEVVEAVKNKHPWDSIPGIVFRNMEGKIQRNPPRKFEDINNFPPVPYQLLDLNLNIRGSNLGKRTIRYNSSQGCPHRCGFCVDPVVYPGKWSGLKAERVVSDIIKLKHDYHIDSVIMTDSNFFTNLERAKKIARLLIDSNINIKWGNANGRTHQLLKYTHDDWKLLKSSGLEEVLVGAESALQEGLDLIQKDTTTEETVELAKVCSKHGITIRFSMMVGLPYDLPKQQLMAMGHKELKEVLHMMDSIYKLGDVRNRALLFVYLPYPGTRMYDSSLKLGTPAPKSLEDWGRFELNIQNTTWVDKSVSNTVAMLTEYIWPWLEDEYMGNIKSMSLKTKLIMYPAALFLRFICRFRWSTKFFKYPIDYKIFNYLMKKRKII